MVSLQSTIARNRAVQRIQIVRQQRVGKLLVQVRHRAQAVATTQKRFSETLATVAALKCGIKSQSGTELKSELAPRLDNMVNRACSGLARTEVVQRKLAEREKFLSAALGQAKKAEERGRESQIEASHTISRLRETADLVEVQSGDDLVVESSLASTGDDNSLVEEVVGPFNDLSLRNEPLSTIPEKGPLFFESLSPASSHILIQEPISLARLSECIPQKPTIVRHLPSPLPSSPIREVVITAELPGSSGSIEVAHSPQQGVTISLRTRNDSFTSSARRAFKGLRESLAEEGVRIAAIDLLDEEA